MNYYTMSDIHGFYDEMLIALEESGYYDDPNPKKIVICGDIFDRGTKNCEVQDFVVKMLEKEEIILIRGNHEDLLEDLVLNLDTYGDCLMYSHHLSNGTAKTLSELTGFNFRDFKIKTMDVKRTYYNSPFHKVILPKMLNYYETSKYIFVHGWIPCNVSGYGGEPYYYEYNKNWRNANRTEWEYARWYNGIEAAFQGAIEPKKIIVCGHWNASYGHARGNEIEAYSAHANHSVYFGKGIIALDACTVISKRVNCIKLTDE